MLIHHRLSVVTSRTLAHAINRYRSTTKADYDICRDCYRTLLIEEALGTTSSAVSSKDSFEAVLPPRLQSATARQQSELAAFDTETAATVERILSDKRRGCGAPATLEAHVSAVQAATADSTEHTLLCEQALAWIARQPLAPKVSARFSSKIMQEYMLVQKRALKAARPTSDSPRSADVREPVTDVAEPLAEQPTAAVDTTADAATAAAATATAAVKEVAQSMVNDIVELMTGAGSQLAAATTVKSSSGTDATVQTAAAATAAATTQTTDSSVVESVTELVIDTDEDSISTIADSRSNSAATVQDVLTSSVVDSSNSSSSSSSSSKPATGNGQSLLAMSIGNLARSFSNAKNSIGSGSGAC
jgi:trimeric autotransporter adhesin